MFNKIKNFFIPKNDFREIKKEEQKTNNENKIKKVFSKRNIFTIGGIISSYFIGKFIMKKQFTNALLSCDFITPPVNGLSNILGVNSLDDIVENTIQLHKKGEIANYSKS